MWKRIVGVMSLFFLCLAGAGEEVTISGSVVGPDGEPVADARVWARSLALPDGSPPESTAALGPDGPFATTTDDRGSFRIDGLPPDAVIQLSAERPGGEPFLLYSRYHGGQEGIRIILKPLPVICGRVTQEGRPVAGVRVFAVCEGDTAEAGPPETVSDADGRYVLDGLRTGVHTVTAEPPEGMGARPVENIAVWPGDRVRGVDIEIIPGGLVRGYVIETHTGDRFVAATVRFRGPAYMPVREATTDKNGVYAIHLAPGLYTVEFAGSRDVPAEWATRPETTVTVVGGGVQSGPAFHLQRPVRISGHVIGMDGKPAAGVEVGCQRRYWEDIVPEEFFRARADEEGRFTLDLTESGPWRRPWVVFARDVDRGLAGLGMVDDPGEEMEVRLGLTSAVQGEVFDRDGQPVADATIQVFADRGGTYVCAISSGRTDAQGRFRISGLPSRAGIWVRRGAGIFHEALDPQWGEDASITLAPGEVRTLPRLVVNREGRVIRGRVVNPQGQPVAEAVVGLLHAEGPVLTEADGTFRATTPVAVGEVWVVAAHPSEPLLVAQEVDPDPNAPVDLTLIPAGGAAGQIVDEQGKPIEEVRVSLWVAEPLRYRIPQHPRLDKALVNIRAQMGDDGKWTVDGLIAGLEYGLGAYLPCVDRSPPFPHFTAKPGETVDLGQLVLQE